MGSSHDIGKPRTTTIEDGEIKTPRHSIVGSTMARTILSDLNITYYVRKDICDLIRHHTKPPHIIEAEDPASYVIKTSWLCKNHFLYIVSMADIVGRISNDKIDSIFCVNMWKSICEENACFTQGYNFLNSHARVMFYTKGNFQPYHTPYMEDMFDVYLLCGLPGTGKTYYAKNKLSKHPLVELDLAREELDVKPMEEEGKVLQLTKEMCREQLRLKRSFVFSATNILRSTRMKWIDLFISYGAKVNIIYLEKPLAVILKQNRERDRNVPENVIMAMRNKIEIPNWDEAHDITYIVN